MSMLRGQLRLAISIMPRGHLTHNVADFSAHHCLLLLIVCKLILVFDHVSVALRILIVQENRTRSLRLTSKTRGRRITSL